MTTRTLAARTRELIATLQKQYGRPRAPRRKDPLSELIFTILSQNTSDLNRDRAWASLWKVFGSWEEIVSAPPAELEEAIRVGGLAPTKSRVIQQVLREVKAREGAYSLDRLRAMDMGQVESYLAGLKGVGLKTIRCVQVFSLGQPAFPVDTHIFRITRRLGLLPARATPARAHQVLGEATPPDEVLPFHINLIRHGREICKAGRPLCEDCVLRAGCRHGKKAG